MRLPLPPFTLVGATTRAGLLPAPLRDRFGIVHRLDLYEAASLTTIVRRSATLLGAPITDEGAQEIAHRSRGTPRVANRLLRRVRDFAHAARGGHHHPRHGAFRPRAAGGGCVRPRRAGPPPAHDPHRALRRRTGGAEGALGHPRARTRGRWRTSASRSSCRPAFSSARPGAGWSRCGLAVTSATPRPPRSRASSSGATAS